MTIRNKQTANSEQHLTTINLAQKVVFGKCYPHFSEFTTGNRRAVKRSRQDSVSSGSVSEQLRDACRELINTERTFAYRQAYHVTH